MDAIAMNLEKEFEALEPEDAQSIQRALLEMIQLVNRKRGPALSQPMRLTQPYVTQASPLGLKVGNGSHKWSDWIDEAEGPGWK